MTKYFLPLLVTFLLLNFRCAYAVATWQEQAERLQKVSATLLDDAPIGDPIDGTLGIEFRSAISFLPTVSSHVGEKNEKVPSSPIHAVPTFAFNSKFFSTAFFSLGASVCGGYLVPGAERLMGIHARLSQLVYGAAFAPSFQFSWGSLFTWMGYQVTTADLTGGITEVDASDSFHVNTRLGSLAVGVQVPSWGLWFNVMLAKKSSTSRFEIPADQTTFQFSDTLGDASPALMAQASLGYRHPSGVQIALSELRVPKRLTMPRLLLSYQFNIL